ncbi:MAG: carboxypeptidase-like regulatory domain-containing protein [Chitinophagaceae bacterium]|nr:carboxypeptidase-like regulatory domain-containing protein [Chitinophagaceae bacterium]
MATDNNIKHFTAADIEKYHQGLLSPAAMHEMEKAALDDSFLADALEGYAVAGVKAREDIAELQKKLAEKIDGSKVIRMNAAPRNSFRMLRAAVLLAFVAGAGLLIYQFGFNKKSGEVAQAKTTKKETDTLNDSSKTSATKITTPVSENKPAETKSSQTKNGFTSTTPDNGSKPGGAIKNGLSGETSGVETMDDVVVNKPAAPQTAVPDPQKGVEEKIGLYKETDKTADKKELAREDAARNAKLKNNRQEMSKNEVKDSETEQKSRSVNAGRKTDEPYYRDQATNTFRGQVTDASNTGVPFASVISVQDKRATYTDANGNFILSAPDTTLQVQVRSVGYENNTAQLRNDVTNNRVILQNDQKNLSEVVVINQKNNTGGPSPKSKAKAEEPEPVDGWDIYAVYLTNNLKVPEDFKSKQTNTAFVELSFEVNKNGNPANIKIEKSLCTSCDKEAIRLVKEGPKWNRKAKKTRTTITISFANSF